ncbi:TIGR00730 family Rossman fold protein [Nevskia sp.]|uniref:LOG family protein n=1 Tax=Nevskia sp. TaxID=1929292 RepID=UPI0025D2B92E|nr:TIGR00730 family Rossman fold protein [Nevskia sp.]
MTKAYKNQEFLLSDEARGVRMLCEYLEPKQRLEAAGVKRAIILFGSARTRRLQPAPGKTSTPDYYALAADLAERFARWTTDNHEGDERYFLVTGGGPGIMEAGHEGGARVDRNLNIGFNISLPFEQHVNPFVKEDHSYEFHYFFMRKFWFMNVAEAFVVFPGGFGTLDELFEALTLTQTGKARPMPVVLFGKEFWDGLVNFERLVERGLVSRADVDSLVMAETVDEAFEAIVSGLAQPKRPRRT